MGVQWILFPLLFLPLSLYPPDTAHSPIFCPTSSILPIPKMFYPVLLFPNFPIPSLFTPILDWHQDAQPDAQPDAV